MQPRENKNVTQIVIKSDPNIQLKEKLSLTLMSRSPYQLAWDAYQKTADHASSVKAMSEKGMIQPYINNILELAFMAGRNSK